MWRNVASSFFSFAPLCGWGMEGHGRFRVRSLYNLSLSVCVCLCMCFVCLCMYVCVYVCVRAPPFVSTSSMQWCTKVYEFSRAVLYCQPSFDALVLAGEGLLTVV